MTARITSPQTKQIGRFMADALDNLTKELARDGAQRLIERGDGFQEAIQAIIRRFSAKAPDYTLAREILGDDFISPEEIAEARGLTYTDEQIEELGSSLPSQEVLEWCRDNDYILVAGPPKAMSLLDIRELERSHFYSKQGGWYSNEDEAFARNDKAETRWLVIRKTPVPNSTRKNWEEQQALLSDVEITPNIAELVWTLTTYKAVRDTYLLPSLYARTSSVDSDGNRVHVGIFGRDGLDVGNWLVGSRYSSLGVSAARKF